MDKNPKFVQLVAVGSVLHALDDEGGVWALAMGQKRIGSESVYTYETASWVKLPPKYIDNHTPPRGPLG